MTDNSAPRFDPRFNPEFQPGYTPGDPVPSTAAQPPAPSALSAPTVVSTVPASAPPAARRASSVLGSAPVLSPPGSPAPASSVPPSSAVVSSPTYASSATSESGEASDDAPSIGQQLRNPFLLGLIVVAVALVIVGSWIFAQAYAAFSDTGNFASPADFVALELIAAPATVATPAIAATIDYSPMYLV